MNQSCRSALLALTLCALPPTSAARAETGIRSDLPTTGEITLFQSPGRVMVMMRIGADELVPMIFDTGSDGHSIDRSVVARHKLKRMGSTIEIDGSTGKQRTLPRVALPNVKVGGLALGTIEATALDYDRDDAMGIITPAEFTASLVYIDLGRSTARLAPRATTAPPPGPAVAYVDHLPTVHMALPEGTSIPAHFDSGFDGALSLPLSMMNKIPLQSPARVVGRFKSINTEGDVWGGRIAGTITIGPLTFDSPEVTFIGDIANIGLPIMRRLILVLDPVAKRNWVLKSETEPHSK